MVLAALCYFRTRGFEKFGDEELRVPNKEESIGHRHSIKKWINELLGEDAHLIEFDDIKRQYLWNQHYIIDKESYSSSAAPLVWLEMVNFLKKVLF